MDRQSTSSQSSSPFTSSASLHDDLEQDLSLSQMEERLGEVHRDMEALRRGNSLSSSLLSEEEEEEAEIGVPGSTGQVMQQLNRTVSSSPFTTISSVASAADITSSPDVSDERMNELFQLAEQSMSSGNWREAEPFYLPYLRQGKIANEIQFEGVRNFVKKAGPESGAYGLANFRLAEYVLGFSPNAADVYVSEAIENLRNPRWGYAALDLRARIFDMVGATDRAEKVRAEMASMTRLEAYSSSSSLFATPPSQTPVSSIEPVGSPQGSSSSGSGSLSAVLEAALGRVDQGTQTEETSESLKEELNQALALVDRLQARNQELEKSIEKGKAPSLRNPH